MLRVVESGNGGQLWSGLSQSRLWGFHHSSCRSVLFPQVKVLPEQRVPEEYIALGDSSDYFLSP